MYSKSFNPDRYGSIAPLLEQIQDLGEGASILVSTDSTEEAREIRWLLYDWFSHMKTKSQFRLREEGEGFRVLRRGVPYSFSLEEKPLPRLLALLFKELLLLSSREEVRGKLEVMGELRKEERELLLSRWERVMGEEED